MTAGVIEAALVLGKQHGVMTAVDPKFSHFWAYRGCSLFKPNLREIQQQLDFKISPDLASLDRAAAVIFDRLGCEEVMITLSEHGIYTHDGRRSAIHATAARRIADVSGAGDTVISVAAAARAAGMSLSEAAQLANVAGAQVISRPGVVAVCAAELREEWSAHRV
jgi:rfaE bifunctional protein kinase chain/domain